MFKWKTWAMILRMFHKENIVFMTFRTAVFRRKVGLTVVLRWSYGGLMIQVTEKHLELSTDKGTKNVCETSDIVRGSDASDRKIFGKCRGYEIIVVTLHKILHKNGSL